MTSVDLLDKTEVWIYGTQLADANLSDIAKVSASVLKLSENKVFVTDVRENHIVLDVLQASVTLDEIIGRESQLLAAIGSIDGVSLAPDASVHSEGVLGVIGAPRESVQPMLDEAERMEQAVRAYTEKRVAVVSTGFEILAGNIEDTNYPLIKECLSAVGYEVESGGAVADNLLEIAGRVSRLSESYAIVFITGGVGAEDKDFTVEALEQLDPNLNTAVLASYRVGHGRHVKESVRIAIAQVGGSLVFALPGPNHEVKAAMPIVLEGLQHKQDPAVLVEAIAEVLRKPLPHAHHHHHRH